MYNLRRLMVAAALAASTVLFVRAEPVQAAVGHELRVCFEVGTTPSGTPIFDCYTIIVPELGPDSPFPPECVYCGVAIDFQDGEIDPPMVRDYLKQLGRGFRLLSKSSFVQDTKLRKELRDEATNAFLASAKLLDGAQVPLKAVGWYDGKSGKLYADPDPQPMLWDTGKHLAAGLQLMQQALGDPDPQPNIEAALDQFGQANDRLSALFAG